MTSFNTLMAQSAGHRAEKCKISAWGCIYHACMSDDCQKQEVEKNCGPGEDWGPGLCEEAQSTGHRAQSTEHRAIRSNIL